MCGIFAYSGPRPATDTLIEGLKKLEYRGYDSSGVAFFHEGRVKRLRAAGAVSKLESLLEKEGFREAGGMPEANGKSPPPAKSRSAAPADLPSTENGAASSGGSASIRGAGRPQRAALRKARGRGRAAAFQLGIGHTRWATHGPSFREKRPSSQSLFNLCGS